MMQPLFNPADRARTLGALTAMVMTLLQPTPAGATSRDEAAFDLYILGMRAGQFVYSAVEANDVYAVTAKLNSTGLAHMIRRFSQDATARGRISGPRLEPQSYARQSVFGSSRSETRITYPGRVPQVRAEPAAQPRPPWALDPATQRGTLDPLTAIYAVLRDMPRDRACATPLAIFDGARRAEVAFAAPKVVDGTITCAAEYRRISGYAPDKMAEQTRFPFRLVFAPAGDGRVRVARMQMNSLLGPATLIRR